MKRITIQQSKSQLQYYSSSEDDEKWETDFDPMMNVFSFGWAEGELSSFISFLCG
jgi:hypothetical protein